MDQDAKDRIIRDMDIEAEGFENELKRVLVEDNNQDKVYRKQRQALRSRLTSDKTNEGGKVEKWGHEYVNVKGEGYKRLSGEGDVKRSSSGDLFLVDEKGRYKEIIEDQ